MPRMLLVAGLFLTGINQGHAQEPDLSGCWHGRWEDCKSGHDGPLRATLERCGDDRYRATFTGRFCLVIPFRYTVVLNVVSREGDRVVLAGENHLPFFGTFNYTADATATDFTANFNSRRYEGRFMLHR